MNTDKPMSENHMPRIMIAAASSGSGKTVITTGLLCALKRRGITAASFKCGPDYIDPMFHKTVLGIEGKNLDSFFIKEDAIKQLVITCGGDIAVIEGVMGIYDGTSCDSIDGSCYEIAKITKTPVILVVNAAGVGKTVASVIKGILADDDKKLIKGVILNRMSPSFYERFEDVLEGEIRSIRDDVKLIGYIPKNDSLHITSRYLGLTLPDELTGIKEKIEKTADLLDEGCDIDAIINIAEHAEKLCVPEKEAGTKKPERRLRLAVAKDEAFCFYYEENIKLLEKYGIDPVYFSPVHDARLPDGVSGIMIGGGYPELFLKELSANSSMLESIRDAHLSKMPSIAECGGFMYLHKAIEDKDGRLYETVGVIDGVCKYTGHLVNFGYVEIADDAHPKLCGLKGHEFHYYDSTADCADLILRKPSTKRQYKAMGFSADHLWGFAHFYYPSNEGIIWEFVKRMREYEDR